ncbi:MAG TPA: nitrilase-related carbon-nitrogen hydrolase [Longimicrobiales bacterium]
MNRRPLQLAVFQSVPVLRDPVRNAASMVEAAAATDAHLLVTPELSLTGYDVGDAAAELAIEPSEAVALLRPALSRGIDVVVGMIERSATGVPYNTAAHLREDGVVFRHRKVYLPTYGMFDEGRFFGRGDRVDAYPAGHGWRAGLLVCEDFWHPALSYLLAVRGIDVLVVQAAAPGRGVWAGAEAGGRFASADTWERIARVTAQLYGIYVVLANRAGVEGGVTFAGGSLIVAPTGEVVARAPDAGEAVIAAWLDPAEVERARRPYAHARDEDPHFTQRELARILEEPSGRR